MTQARETACSAPPPPEGLAAVLDGYSWARDAVGESGGAVYRLHGRAGAPGLYLKHGEGIVADDVVDEAVRLRWLAAHVPVPAVRHLVLAEAEAWLVTEAVPGRTAYQCLEDGDDPAGVVDALALFLRRLHAIPVERWPFNADHRLRLALARDRIAAGLVDEDEFDEARAGQSAADVHRAMTALLPLPPDAVVTHGDFSLDNLILGESGWVCIDAGRAGVADRYQDLAILWNCLGEFDPALQARLFASYGIAVPDARRLQFHLMLDEMF